MERLIKCLYVETARRCANPHEKRGRLSKMYSVLTFLYLCVLICSSSCLTQFAKYTCPRCNVRYCSLLCYKSEVFLTVISLVKSIHHYSLVQSIHHQSVISLVISVHYQLVIYFVQFVHHCSVISLVQSIHSSMQSIPHYIISL